jgi:lysozyme
MTVLRLSPWQRDRCIKVQVVVDGKTKYVIAPGLIKRRAEESAPFLVKDASTAASK